MPKRLRILAGPNGSGKSSVYRSLKQNKNFHWGIFVNADEMEKQLRENRFIDLAQYGLSTFPWEEYDGSTGELAFKNDEIPNWVAQYALGQ